MKRPVRPDEAHLWSVVTATVRPLRAAPPQPSATEARGADERRPPPVFGGKPAKAPYAGAPAAVARPPPKRPLEAIEPRRARHIARRADGIDARLDLHGMNQDAARRALHAFILGAQAAGFRAVLVITGKGALGDGVLRRRAPEWLGEPAVRHAVAGLSEAHRRHGGVGALYVALKRN